MWNQRTSGGLVGEDAAEGQKTSKTSAPPPFSLFISSIRFRQQWNILHPYVTCSANDIAELKACGALPTPIPAPPPPSPPPESPPDAARAHAPPDNVCIRCLCSWFYRRVYTWHVRAVSPALSAAKFACATCDGGRYDVLVDLSGEASVVVSEHAKVRVLGCFCGCAGIPWWPETCSAVACENPSANASADVLWHDLAAQRRRNRCVELCSCKLS